MFIVVILGDHRSYLVSSYPTRALAEKAASFASYFSTDALEVIDSDTQEKRTWDAMFKVLA